jgi:hypothetical protein
MSLVFCDSANRYITGVMEDTNMTGVWASVPTGIAGENYSVAEPSFGARVGTKAFLVESDANGENVRATLANLACTEIFFACAFYLPNLPSGAARRRVEFANSANTTVLYMSFEPSGTMAFYDVANVKVAETSSACIVAGEWTWFEMRLAPAAGVIQVRNAAGTQILNESITPIAETLGIIRFRVVYNVAEQNGQMYFSCPAVKDILGGEQDTWYAGERKNFLLNAVEDDPASDWGFVARRMYDVGVGEITVASGNHGWRVADAAALELGAGDYTIEGTYRWNALPGVGESQYLASKWFPGSAQSWALRLYESGGDYYLEFAISTTGTSGGEVVVHDFPFEPLLYTPYNIAVCRNTSVNRLFIDGVRNGAAVADANTYHDNASQLVVAARQSAATTLTENFNGWVDEFRYTVGVGRYTAEYTPATDEFPRSGTDPDWASVQLLMGWDTASIDESQYGRTVTQNGPAAQLTTDDGLFAYQSIDKNGRDDTFVEAAYLAASGTLELTANALNGSQVVVGTTTYTFNTVLGGADSVLIGVDADASLFNLISAINGAAGIGTLYGIGTVTNADVIAAELPGAIASMEALVPGTAGNAIVFTTTVAGAIISGAGTLTGGVDIPSPGIYKLERLPSGLTVVESVSLFTRRSVYGPGSAEITPSFIDAALSASSGANTAAPANPGWQVDHFSANGGGAWATADFIDAKIQVDRTL